MQRVSQERGERETLIAGVVGWTDLTSPAIADELARLAACPGGAHLVGIRHQVQSEPDPGWLARPDVLRGLRAVAAAGLRYDVLTLPHQLAAATRAADQVPELTLILDHAGKPQIDGGDLAEWRAAITAFAARRLGFGKEDEIAIVFCGSKKSLISGVPMAGILFPPASVGLVVLPLMLFHQMQLMACAVIAQRYAARPR